MLSLLGTPRDPTHNQHSALDCPAGTTALQRGGWWSTKGWKGRGLGRKQGDGASDTSLRSDTHLSRTRYGFYGSR